MALRAAHHDLSNANKKSSLPYMRSASGALNFAHQICAFPSRTARLGCVVFIGLAHRGQRRRHTQRRLFQRPGTTGVVGYVRAIFRITEAYARFGGGMKEHRMGNVRRSPLSKGISLAFAGVLSIASQRAVADCTPVLPTAGSTVTCSGGTLVGNPFNTAQDNLIVNVTADGRVAPVLGLLTPAMVLSGKNVTLNNAGMIDPSFLG